MYLPAHFVPGDDAVADLLTNNGAADLITSTQAGLVATMLPFIFEPEVGEHGTLLGHLARNNDQWQEPAFGEALVIVRGPDSYVSPSWYPSKFEHGRVVPTWNYVTAHVYGELIVHDDVEWVAGLVRRLTDLHEAANPSPWSADDAPSKFIAGQLRAIVGVEIRITRVQAKFKLSQNRPAADIDGVIAGLDAAGAHDAAAAVRATRIQPNIPGS
ncbi:FMN-binding negative transcriptional regulator [Aldersonia sp. NBC_00410]|uniref:FMN-binding negative transcriptional regulator n=1 Tax=Aldersonia sp. NBC_00410 TaxID=2975954 RepID=UPI00225BB1D7|nr:FMN-binding negative transcriptional regulator [Aldersonia sp. NBC_00410]MCX5042110.1 FMN-binding negative transcriptional regulator [Aldersonia sp. NBC_00410]